MSSQQEFDPPIGVAQSLEPGVRRIVAPNPSPMTFRGTNTYLVGDTDIAVIDPGPLNEIHLEAILAALTPGQHVSHIFVTHAHNDHAPLARSMARETGAPIYAFGPAHAGRSQTMNDLAASGLVGGGEGIDATFKPDVVLQDGAAIEGSNWHLRALHTPGHIGNHLCFALGAICFTGDHVMGWASSLVSPPDGDLTDFMTSCAKLQLQEWRRFYPGHGAPITDPAVRLDWLIRHRRKRETAILDVLSNQPSTASEIATRVYVDTAPNLLPAATRNVLAHLVDLTRRGLVVSEGKPCLASKFDVIR